MSFILSFERWDGMYLQCGYSLRLCLGWMAITIIPADIDTVFDRLRGR